MTATTTQGALALPGLEGRVALVTGAAGGIGRATAELLHAHGARVVAVDLDGEAAAGVARDLDGALPVAAGIDTAAGVAAAFDAAEKAFGGVDLLVNNAGILSRGRLHEFDDDDWDRTIGVNLKGVYLCAKRFTAGRVRSEQGGAIVNVASLAHLGMTQQVAYSSSKGGVVTFTRSCAMELARYGIRSNAVAPGMIETPMAQGEPHLRERMVQAIPLRRYGQPREIAWTIAFLLSDAASYVTGETIHVGGGGRL